MLKTPKHTWDVMRNLPSGVKACYWTVSIKYAHISEWRSTNLVKKSSEKKITAFGDEWMNSCSVNFAQHSDITNDTRVDYYLWYVMLQQFNAV